MGDYNSVDVNSSDNPRIFRDGDQFCVLLGDNIHVGIVGFGDTPNEAYLAWQTDMIGYLDRKLYECENGGGAY